jgi:hypothetical protein
MADSQTPQFNTAEYGSKPGANTCRSCKQTISGAYYRINGALACHHCVQQLQNQIPKDTHGVFTRGLIFGIAGAILGLVLYAAFGIVTGLMIGYISLAVGYIVGKAMLMGSGGIGGRRYQIAAVLLTYFAVSTAAIPIGISQFMKVQKAKPHTSTQSSAPRSNDPSRMDEEDVSGGDPGSTATPDNPPAHKKSPPSLGTALGALLVLGLASPFLELASPLHGLIGLVILFVGLQIAWKLTAGKKVDILGPFGESVPPPPLG